MVVSETGINPGYFWYDCKLKLCIEREKKMSQYMSTTARINTQILAIPPQLAENHVLSSVFIFNIFQ